MCLILGYICVPRSIILTLKQNDCVKDKNYLFEASSRQSDCGECQNEDCDNRISPIPLHPPKKSCRGLGPPKNILQRQWTWKIIPASWWSPTLQHILNSPPMHYEIGNANKDKTHQLKQGPHVQTRDRNRRELFVKYGHQRQELSSYYVLVMRGLRN